MNLFVPSRTSFYHHGLLRWLQVIMSRISLCTQYNSYQKFAKYYSYVVFIMSNSYILHNSYKSLVIARKTERKTCDHLSSQSGVDNG